MSVINWFEIPVTDIERAAEFYGKILNTDLVLSEPMPGTKMAQFRGEGPSGALFQGEDYVPSSSGGVQIYLNAGDDIQAVVDRIEEAGGQVAVPKMDIGEDGFIAFLIDTEGNRIGLHAMS